MGAASASSQLLSTARGEPPPAPPPALGWLIWCCPMISEPSASSAPRLMWSSARVGRGGGAQGRGQAAWRGGRRRGGADRQPEGDASAAQRSLGGAALLARPRRTRDDGGQDERALGDAGHAREEEDRGLQGPAWHGRGRAAEGRGRAVGAGSWQGRVGEGGGLQGPLACRQGRLRGAGSVGGRVRPGAAVGCTGEQHARAPPACPPAARAHAAAGRARHPPTPTHART